MDLNGECENIENNRQEEMEIDKEMEEGKETNDSNDDNSNNDSNINIINDDDRDFLEKFSMEMLSLVMVTRDDHVPPCIESEILFSRLYDATFYFEGEEEFPLLDYLEINEKEGLSSPLEAFLFRFNILELKMSADRRELALLKLQKLGYNLSMSQDILMAKELELQILLLLRQIKLLNENENANYKNDADKTGNEKEKLEKLESYNNNNKRGNIIHHMDNIISMAEKLSIHYAVDISPTMAFVDKVKEIYLDNSNSTTCIPSSILMDITGQIGEICAIDIGLPNEYDPPEKLEITSIIKELEVRNNNDNTNINLDHDDRERMENYFNNDEKENLHDKLLNSIKIPTRRKTFELPIYSNFRQVHIEGSIEKKRGKMGKKLFSGINGINGIKEEKGEISSNQISFTNSIKSFLRDGKDIKLYDYKKEGMNKDKSKEKKKDMKNNDKMNEPTVNNEVGLLVPTTPIKENLSLHSSGKSTAMNIASLSNKRNIVLETPPKPR